LKAEGLVKHYPIRAGVLRRTVGHVKAVDGVSFELYKGETLGIVGESGCGKSTLAKLLMRLETPTAGRAKLNGRDIFKMNGPELRKLRRNVQMVMQDPYTSLNPRMTVGDIVGEPFEIHPEVAPRGDRQRRVRELLDLVGLNPEHINRYPHQFSGGMRQRVMIAMSLAMEPKVLIADEPTTALDVTVQAQIMDLLAELRRDLNMGLILITHDLGVVADVADRIAVMYAGRIVEHADVHPLYKNPAHPYPKGLLESIPRLDSKGTELATIKGLPPNLMRPPSGCKFHPRCKYAQEICVTTEPPLLELGNDRSSACHFAKELLDGRI
jgi:oligopeptide/dipeptide ABC transporter ATP-binding protein